MILEITVYKLRIYEPETYRSWTKDKHVFITTRMKYCKFSFLCGKIDKVLTGKLKWETLRYRNKLAWQTSTQSNILES